VFVLLHRIVTLERSEGWVDGGRSRAGWSLLRAGLVLGAVGLVLGTLVAPHLPGVDEDPLVDWRRGNDSNGARTLTSPLVDIRKRIVDTSSTLLFTVDSPTRSYWRITALDRFNGQQWGFRANTDEVADGSLEVDPLVQLGDGTEVRQQVHLEQVLAPLRVPTGGVPTRRRANRPVRRRDHDVHRQDHGRRGHLLRGHLGAARLHPRRAPGGEHHDPEVAP
jgi:hypothetical protein